MNRPADHEPERRRAILVALAVAGLVGALAWSAARYRYPPAAARLLAHATGKPGFLPPANPAEARVERSQWPQPARAIPQALTAPLTATGEIGRIDELRRRPSLLIEGATLVFGPDAPDRIAASHLILRNATLIANGRPIAIEVETLSADNSEIRNVALTETAPANGPGKSGGEVQIIVHGRMRGALRVDLSGQAGANGAAGKPGAPGQPGARGANAQSAADGVCRRPAGAGEPGRPGGPGGDGGRGANGGDGGRLIVKARDRENVARRIDFAAEGGRGGGPGPGGAGGPGGEGGLGGEPAGGCIGQGPRGPGGPDGPDGSPGAAGKAGAPGAMTIAPIE